MHDVVVFSADPDADPCIALVRDALEVRGATLGTVSTARYPDGLPLCLDLDGVRTRATLGATSLDHARAFWVRHAWGPASLPAEMRADHRAACEAQSAAALSALLSCVDGFVLDPVEVLLSGGTKPWAQKIAARLGLDTPRTLVTNDPEAARAFVRAQASGAVCKLVESGSVSLADGVLPTTEVTDDDLAQMEGLRVAPMIFQEKLAKALELRVTVVGAEVFVAAVAPGDVIDVRTDPALVRSYRVCEKMPEAVRAGLLRLLDRLRLNFATADIVLTHDDRWVLLEVNSTSFFDHVERYAGLPISGAIADLLLGRAAPRVPMP